MAEPLKQMYNGRFFDALIAALRQVYTAFDGEGFLARVYDGQWDGRELKARMRHITLSLGALLPADYPAALDIMRKAAPQLAGFSYETIIFPDFVEVFGLGNWELSVAALEQFTQQSSGEFAVRPFILQDTGRMMEQMRAWAQHPNHHVRRLASEGCRPRLPWAMALPAFKADPAPILPILETLKQDESEYVRRSVANNLNDIAKDNPQVVLAVVQDWQTYDTAAMRALIRHALRTLVKKGDAAALALLGYAGQTAFTVDALAVEPVRVTLGDAVTFSFQVWSQGSAPQNLLIDYVLHFRKANGQLAPKVFKLSKRILNPGETVKISRSHSFKPISTRRYYPGTHAVSIQINGTQFGHCAFELLQS